MQIFKPIKLVKNLPLSIECLSSHRKYLRFRLLNPA